MFFFSDKYLNNLDVIPKVLHSDTLHWYCLESVAIFAQIKHVILILSFRHLWMQILVWKTPRRLNM